MKFFKSIRTRLTLWYLAVMVILLLMFSSVAYLMLDHNLYQNLDNALRVKSTQLNAPSVIIPQSDEILLSFNYNGTLNQEIGTITVDTAKLSGLVKQALSGQKFLSDDCHYGQSGDSLYATSFLNLFNDQPVVVVVGQLTTEITDVLRTFMYIIIFAMIGVLVLAGLGGLFLADRVLRPVERITKTAQKIEGGDLSQRIDVKTDDELGRLAVTLNEMIGRLEEAFSRQRQFYS